MGLNDGRLQTDQTVANLRRLVETIRDLGGRHVTVAQLPTKIPPFAPSPSVSTPRCGSSPIVRADRLASISG